MRDFPQRLASERLLGVLIVALVLLMSASMPVQVWMRRNLAYTSFLDMMMAETTSAVARQAGLASFNNFLQHEQFLAQSTMNRDRCEQAALMLHSIFIGEYYRYWGKLDMAQCWYARAASADPIPAMQRDLSYAERSRLTSSGDLFVTGPHEHWLPSDANNTDTRLTTDDRSLGIWAEGRPDQRDIADYTLYPWAPISIGYHNTLALRVKLTSGAFLTVETLIDGQLERHLSYYQGKGGWEEIRLPLAGKEIQSIVIGIGEPPDQQSQGDINVQIDWIKLELPETLAP